MTRMFSSLQLNLIDIDVTASIPKVSPEQSPSTLLLRLLQPTRDRSTLFVPGPLKHITGAKAFTTDVSKETTSLQ